MSILKKIVKGKNEEEKQVTPDHADSELSAEDISTEEADTDLSEIKTIQEFIEMKRRQNQILEKLLEKITQHDKSNTDK